jgi:hypothetical protein
MAGIFGIGNRIRNRFPLPWIERMLAVHISGLFQNILEIKFHAPLSIPWIKQGDERWLLRQGTWRSSAKLLP